MNFGPCPQCGLILIVEPEAPGVDLEVARFWCPCGAKLRVAVVKDPFQPGLGAWSLVEEEAG